VRPGLERLSETSAAANRSFDHGHEPITPLALVLAFLFVAVLGAPASARTSNPCAVPAKSHVVYRHARVVVWTRDRPTPNFVRRYWYGCLRGISRPQLLVRGVRSDDENASVQRITSQEETVALQTYNRIGHPDVFATIVVRNLRRRSGFVVDAGGGTPGDFTIRSVRVSSQGVAAWVRTRIGMDEVVAARRPAIQLLDQSPLGTVDPSSLTVRRTTVTWTRDGQVHQSSVA
jgi:hypothetical protein